LHKPAVGVRAEMTASAATAVHSIPSWFGCNGAAPEKPMIGSTQRAPDG
jgi:hypothetical protein